MTLQYLRCQTDDVLPLVVLYQVEILQRGDYILLAYARPFTYLAAQNKYKTVSNYTYIAATRMHIARMQDDIRTSMALIILCSKDTLGHPT